MAQLVTMTADVPWPGSSGSTSAAVDALSIMTSVLRTLSADGGAQGETAGDLGGRCPQRDKGSTEHVVCRALLVVFPQIEVELAVGVLLGAHCVGDVQA